MAKLHELLAVESNLRSQAEACRKDLLNTFEKKRHHFSEQVVTFNSSKEGIPDKKEEVCSLQTTVQKELAWISEKMASAIDIGYQVDLANTVAVANVEIDFDNGMSVALLDKIPATSLLQLEKRLKEIQEIVANIPTLDPAKGFTPDPDRGPGIYKARDIEKPRTEKTFEFIVMVPPTDKHPAQVKELMTDKPIGTVVGQDWSSLITVADKALMLDRVEYLTREVKKARSRANEAEINAATAKIGQRIMDFIIHG